GVIWRLEFRRVLFRARDRRARGRQAHAREVRGLKVAYDPPDYYGIEELLSAEERMVRDTARCFVEEEYLPLITSHFRQSTFPMRSEERRGGKERRTEG